MSEDRNDGGPAFPVKGGMLFYYPKELEEQLRGVEEGVRSSFDGMTLRDWLAGQALASIMAFGGSDMWNTDRQPPMAALAYEMADAMLAARQKP